MWILLWIVLSAFVLGVFFWSTAILQQQKKAWSAVAKKLNLTFKSGTFTSPPVITGTVKNHRVTFFTDTEPSSDARGQRYITAIEIELGSGMPTAAAIATKDFASFLLPVRLTQTLTPAVEGWNPENIVKTRDRNLLARYLTPERQKILHGLCSMKNAATLFFFDQEDALLRIQTADPLRNAERMEKIIRRILAAVDGLALTEQERNETPAYVPPTPSAPMQAPPATPLAAADTTGPAAPIILPDDVTPADVPSQGSDSLLK